MLKFAVLVEMRLWALLSKLTNPKAWNSSTRRSLRTLLHGLVALITGLPVVIPVVTGALGVHGLTASATTLVAWCAAVSKVINKLEDVGWLPSVLKGAAAPVVADDPVEPVDEPVDLGQDGDTDVDIDANVDVDLSVDDVVDPAP